ncbi:hypothetical protein MKEN_00158200 [Mycena kentingensis (nom. inval.)]|nr:hypothetical protein MKEN_00158200 [Mycena kentingensis (nom. inval.)]
MRSIFITLVLAAMALATAVPQPHASPVPTPEQQAAIDAKYAAILASGQSTREPTSLEKRDVHCGNRLGHGTTSTSEALACATFIQGLGNQGVQCANQMPNPGCQQMVVRGSTAAWICGPRGSSGPCSDAANGLFDVANMCNNGGTTGGSCDFVQANMGDTLLLLAHL